MLLYCRLLCRAAVLALFALGISPTISGMVPGADAQDGTDIVKTLEPVLEKARETGATIIVVDPNASAKKNEDATAGDKPNMVGTLTRARAELSRIVASSGGLVPSIRKTLGEARPDGSMVWMLWALLIAAIAIAVGEFVRRRLRDWGRKQFLNLYDPNPRNRSTKIGYLLSRAALMLIGVALFLVVAQLVASFSAPGDAPARLTAQIIVLAVAVVLAVRIVLFNILVPDASSHRMINLTDEDAEKLFRGNTIVIAIAAAMLSVCAWMEALGLNQDAHKLMLILATFVSAAALSVLAVTYRKAVAGAITGACEHGAEPSFFNLMARNWHVLAIAYVVAAGAVSTMRLILDMPSALGLVSAPVNVLIIALVVYAIGLLIIDRFFAHSERKAEIVDVSEQSDGSSVALDGLPDDVVDAEIKKVEDVADKARMRNDFRELIEHGLSILVVLGSFAAVVVIWSPDVAAENSWVGRLIDLASVIFIAYMAYRATVIWIDRQIEEEDPSAAADPGESEMGHGGGSRLATLLPIFRNFLLISIVVIAAMIGLSELGVDIGPLFAGAGVVGLAIGFGAQTLVRDIFSGAFFLMDDAFRKGEYIDLGSVKGTVEKISIRSFQLRHHNGPLNTVPFGEIKQLTNFSRDWVLMKLPLRVTYDTDVERVRKLIKKLGQELLKDPDIGHFFLQPLKSQGVNVMEDSAMIIRVKFMTKPGDQFLVKRVVYTRIRELFEKEGIKFAHREVTVRIADDGEDGGRELTPAQKEAIAGAVLPAIEEQAREGKAEVDDRG